MEALGIAAGIVGITAPTLHCVRLLLDDLRNIADAPETLKSLSNDLLAVDQALTSLQAISDAQWQSLGAAVVAQSKTATTSCMEACDRFRAALGRWNGKLSWRDRAMVGFLKQGHVKSMSEQLQHCKSTLTSVVCTATLHSSLQQKQATEETMVTMVTIDKQLSEVNTKLGTLCFANQEGETEASRTSVRQVYLPPERPETPPKPFATIPFSRDPDFVNRGDILDRLDQRCSAARVALVGLGGVGKSQLAIEFAHRIAESQPDTWVFWVHAGTHARVEQGFRTIADAVELPGRDQQTDLPQLVYNWLSNERNGRWIMILDSADDGDVFFNTNSAQGSISGNAHSRQPLATYLPQSRNGSILITTRSSDLAFRLTGRRQNMIEIGPMTQTDALTLLEKKLGSPADIKVATDLVQALDLVPLAISQAAAYIQARAPRTSPGKYLADFRESERKRSRLLKYDGGDLRRDGGASNAVLTTWTISFDHIRSKRPSAADLLSLMSFFDCQGIPGWALKPSGTAKDTTQDEAELLESADDSSATDSGTADGADDDMDGEFEDDVAMLRDYCLITADEEGDEFEMHGLVQLSTRNWLEAAGKQETFKQQYIGRLAASFASGEYGTWAACRSLFAHVQVALAYRPSEEMAGAWASLLYNGAWYAYESLQGRYDIAYYMASASQKARERRVGKEDLKTLESASLSALLLRQQGRLSEAEKLNIQVMEACKTELGVDHQDTLVSMNNLATIYMDQGRLPEAEKLLVQVVEGSKTKFGVDHPNTLLFMGHLGTIYMDQGRLPDAERLLVRVVEASKTRLGVDHPDTLTGMHNLAIIWKVQGRHWDALALMKECAEATLRVFGEEHPNTRLSLDIVAKWSN